MREVSTVKLNEYLKKIDGRKKTLSIYKAYAIKIGDSQKDALPLNLDLDSFGLTAVDAVKLLLRENAEVFDLLRENIEKDTEKLSIDVEKFIKDIGSIFGVLHKEKDTEITPDPEEDDTFNIRFRKDPWYVAIGVFTIPMEDAKERACCYEVDGTPFEGKDLGSGCIQMTLRDRPYKMSMETFEITGYQMTYKKKHPKGLISNVSLKKVDQGIKGSEKTDVDNSVEEISE